MTRLRERIERSWFWRRRWIIAGFCCFPGIWGGLMNGPRWSFWFCTSGVILACLNDWEAEQKRAGKPPDDRVG